MKKIFLSLFFSLIFSAAFGQLSQFRMIGSGSWTTVNDSTFSSTVTIQSDLTANGFLPTGITDSMYIFTQTGQRYRISSAINLTFSSADLSIVESGGDWGVPVGQVMIYEDNERTAVPSIPFGATGATAKMQEAADSYNSTLIGFVSNSVDSIQHVRDTTSLTPSLGDEFVNSTKDTSGVYSVDRWLLRFGGIGGGGASTFIGLTDTQSSYAGQANKTVVVNSTSLALEFVDKDSITTIRLSPALGLDANESVTNYGYETLDSLTYLFSATPLSTTEYGGWLANGTSGDSIQVSTPRGVVIGDSQAEGHPGRHGSMHPFTGAGASNYDHGYPDSTGQLSYHLQQLTNHEWENKGVGGEQAYLTMHRFYRDVIGDTIRLSPDVRPASIRRKADIAVVITGINDIFAGTPATNIIENLKIIAGMASRFGVECVILTLPGDEIMTELQGIEIQKVNDFLRNGGLNQYHTKIVDYNAWWRKAGYNSDRFGNDLLADDIHPTLVGYDSLANYIFREANLPVLTGVSIDTRISPDGFTGYSRPNSININNTTYAIDDSLDIVPISEFVPDSVWIKINSSDNITGTTYTGFSHINWIRERTVLKDDVSVTPYGQTDEEVFTKLTIQAKDYINRRVLDIKYPQNEGSQYYITMGSSNAIVYHGTDSRILNGSHNVNGIISTNGGFQTASENNRMGSIQVGFPNGASASGTGFGIGKVNSSLHFNTQSSFLSSDFFVLKHWNETIAAPATGQGAGLKVAMSVGNPGANLMDNALIRISPIVNDTNTVFIDRQLSMLDINPTITSFTGGGDFRLFSIRSYVGNNVFNLTSGSTSVGVLDPAARLHITAGTATAGTAPLKLNAGVNLTTPEAGAVEWDGTNLSITQTTGPTRKTIAYTDGIIASNVTIADTESVFDSTTVEGALEELDEMSRNKFFYISGTNTLPLAKGNTSIMLDGTTGPFTVTLTVTNLRAGDEVKVFCNGGSVTLDSSSGGFLRPSVGTNESTIPIDAEGYVLVWDGSNFYQVN